MMNHQRDTELSGDLSALAWVQEELRKTLDNAHKSLRRHLRALEQTSPDELRQQGAPTALLQARNLIHQGVGALELVGMPAPARLLRGSEQVLTKQASGDLGFDLHAVTVLESASFAALDFLRRQLAGKPAPSLSLFPQYRDVLSLAGVERVHPADLWVDEHQEMPAWATGQVDSLVVAAPQAQLRQAIESRLLRYFREGQPEAAHWISDRFEHMAAQVQGRSAQLWALAAAFFEAQAAGLLATDLYAKRMASRLLAQLRAAERGRAECPDNLLQDLSYFCARARRDDVAAPRLAKLCQTLGLASVADIDVERSVLGRYDPALIPVARRRVAVLKETWSAVAAGELGMLAGVHEQAALVADSVAHIYPEGQRLSSALQMALESTVRRGAAPSPELAMEVATTLLCLDASLDEVDPDQPELQERIQKLSTRLEAATAGAPAAPLEPWVEELYRDVSDRQSMGSVVQELRASLADVEQQLDRFNRAPDDRSILQPVPGQLASMRGVLSVLGLEQAAQAVQRMRDDIGSVIEQRAEAAKATEDLADSLGALSFLIDLLGVQPQLAKSLFRFDPVSGRFSAVMGQLKAPTAAPSVGQTPLLKQQAQALAKDVADQAMSVEELTAQLEGLADQATAADDPQLAKTAATARRALAKAETEAEHQQLRADLAQSLGDYGSPTEPMALVSSASVVSESPAPVPMPVPTPVPTPASAAPVASPANPVDREEDDEMLGIFVEEAREVVEQAEESLRRLRHDPMDMESMTSVRRAFHTLKGSARMVGLLPFGEVGWACEQLFNARLAEALIKADAPLLDFSARAFATLLAWVNLVAERQPYGEFGDALIAEAQALRVPGAAFAPVQPDVGAVGLEEVSTFRAPAEEGEAYTDWDATSMQVPADMLEPEVDIELDLSTFEADSAFDTAEFEGGAWAVTEVPEDDDEIGSDAGDSESGYLVGPADDQQDQQDVLEPALGAEMVEVPLEPFEQEPLAQVPALASAPEVAEGAAELETLSALNTDFGVEVVALEEGDSNWMAPEPAFGAQPDQPVGVATVELEAVPVAQPDFEQTATAELSSFGEFAALAESEAVDLPLGVDFEVQPALPADLPLESPALPIEADAAPDLMLEFEVPTELQASAQVEDAQEAQAASAPEWVAPAPEVPEAFEPGHGDIRDTQQADLLLDPELPVAADVAEASSWLASQPLVDVPEALDVVLAQEALSEPAEVIDHFALPMEPSAADEAASPEILSDDGDRYKQVGSLRIQIALFNIFLNEADEQSRRLCTALAEWQHEMQGPVSDTAIALAHSLAGNSATVGFQALSSLARRLEHALERCAARGEGDLAEAALYADVADEIRRVLHQFAAGFLRPVDEALLERLTAHEEMEAALHSRSASFGLMDGDVELTGDAEGDFPSAAESHAGPSPFGSMRFSALESLEPAADGGAVRSESAAVPSSMATAGALAENIDASDAIDPELFDIFVEEGQELLPALAEHLRRWEQAGGGQQDEAVAAMRALHTFKGGARLAGAMRLGELAHRLESAIEHINLHGSANSGTLAPLHAGVDALTEELERLRLGDAVAPAASPMPAAPQTFQAEPLSAMPAWAPEFSVEPVPVPLHEHAHAHAHAHAPQPEHEEPAQARAVPEQTPELEALEEPVAPVQGGEALVAAAASPVASSAPAVDWQRLAQRKAGRGLAAPSISSDAIASASSVRVRAGLLDRMVNHAGEVGIARARMAADMTQMQTGLRELTDNLERLRRQLRDLELQAETQMASRIEAARSSKQSFDPLEMDRFTRVQELTRMLAESVGDVGTVQRTLQQTLQDTEDQLAIQARVNRDLQDDLLRARMVEFDTLSDRLYRVVRQAAKESGKQVRLNFAGGGIELDRAVLDRMAPAFEHLLRNAVVHGIESASLREALGKPASGTVDVVLRQVGNEVEVEVRDDGAGLDLSRIAERARSMGLLSVDSRPTESELASMIFLPGMSTAEKVTELAGRGIGMEVVRSEVTSMGGRIETASTSGRGTAFRMVLPLTTAVTQVVVVETGGLTVALPSTLVELVRRVPAAEVEAAYRSGVMHHGQEEIPFFWLGSLLQSTLQGSVDGRTLPVIVVRSAAQRVAVHVGQVLGNQEVVVKNLGPQLSRLPGLAGMSLLPTGGAVLIYNPVALAAVYGAAVRAQLLAAPIEMTRSVVAQVPVEPVRQSALVMVVDDSLTVRRVTQRLLQREGYRVVLAKDGLDALERLADETPALMLCDIEMPRMDGFDLVHNLRSDPRLAKLPVVMITSRIAEKHQEHARELGVDHYLGKPYNEELLMSLVRQYAGEPVLA